MASSPLVAISQLITSETINVVLDKLFENQLKASNLSEKPSDGEYGVIRALTLSHAGEEFSAVLAFLKPKITDKEIEELDDNERNMKYAEHQARRTPKTHPLIAYRWGIRLDRHCIDPIERYSPEYGNNGLYSEFLTGRIFAVCKTLHPDFEQSNGLLVPKGEGRPWRNEHVLYNPHEREIPMLLIDANKDTIKTNEPLLRIHALLIEKTGGTKEYLLTSTRTTFDAPGD